MFAAIIVGLLVYKRLTGVDVLKNIVLTRPIINALADAAAAVYKVFPGRKELKTVQVVVNAAVKGAELAEQAWKMGSLEKEERNAYAKKLIADMLAEAGIEVTTQVQMIIDGAIEATCMILPHISTKE